MTSPAILDSDFRYLDKKGNLMKSRTELAIAQLLSFLNKSYEYNQRVTLSDGKNVFVDFKTDEGIIEIIDSDEDISKFRTLKEKLPNSKVMAIGHSKYAAQIKELEDVFVYDKQYPQTGSIFLEDPSFAFDYAHILPLVEKCSILHGHTSLVMIELVGQMENNLLIDFGEAKKIVKEAISIFDHKFFINKKYLKEEDTSHYQIQFEGPKGMFDLQVPKNTTYLLEGEATVENLSTELIKILAPRLPKNVDAVGVYIYEGYNKGSHIIANLSRK